MLTKDIAICIRAIDYSETSQIVTLFTRATGKISAIAKGSKRPKSSFDGPIELFSYGNILFSDSRKEKLTILTEFVQKPGFTPRSDDLILWSRERFLMFSDGFDPPDRQISACETDATVSIDISRVTIRVLYGPGNGKPKRRRPGIRTLGRFCL